MANIRRGKSSSSSSSSSTSKPPIKISYNNTTQAILINCGTNELPYKDFTNVEPHNIINVQKNLRYLDSKKDLLGSSNLDDVISHAYGFKTRETPPAYSMLSVIKKAYVNHVASQGFIETKSWAKSKARASLEIKLGANEKESFVFRESGMNLNEDITNGCTDMACFSNTILDPFVRSFATDAVHFPDLGQSLEFDQSFLDYFLKFDKCKKLLSTLLTKGSQTKGNEELATYNYSYEIEYYPEEKIEGEIFYPGRTPRDTPLNEYVIGNENKNAFLQQVQKKSEVGPKKDIVIQIKEMGDVLQVFTMLAWYRCKNKVLDNNRNPTKKNFVMTTIDSIVFLLSIMIQMPCIVYEFKNEEMESDHPKSSAKQKEEKGRTRYLQRYLPQNFTDMEKITQTAVEIINFNDKVKGIINLIKNNQDVYISKTTEIKIKNDFLEYLISVIDFLTSFVGYLTNPSEYTQIKKDEMITLADNANVTLPDFDFTNLLNIFRDKMSKFQIDNTRDPLLPEFLQFLKINFTVYEMFYEKQGKYYASTMTTFLTQCRQQDTEHPENILFFPCNDSQREQRGKVSFAIWCQRHKVETVRQRGGEPILNSGELGVPIYERDIGDGPCVWTLQTVNMYRYLLQDIHNVLKKKLGSVFLSDYILYDFYTLLAFHFQLCNEVYYPLDEQSDIVERIEIPSLSGYLKKGTTFHYLEEFVDYIIEEYNDPENGPDNSPLIGPKSPVFDPGMPENECVDIVLKDLGPKRETPSTTSETGTPITNQSDDVAAGLIQNAKLQEEFNILMNQLKEEVENAEDDFSKYEEFIRKQPNPIAYLIEANEKASELPIPLYDYLARQMQPLLKREGTYDIMTRSMTDRETADTQPIQSIIDAPTTPEHSIRQTAIVSDDRPGKRKRVRSPSSSPTDVRGIYGLLSASPSATTSPEPNIQSGIKLTPTDKPIIKRSIVTEERPKRSSSEKSTIIKMPNLKGGTRKKKHMHKNKRTRGNKKRGKKTRKHTRKRKHRKTRKH